MVDLSRRQQVVNRLRDDVITGVRPAGEQLKQDVVAAELGVSGGSVREALRILESEGLVRHVPNHGVFVSELGVNELTQLLLPLRLLIESYAVPLGLDELRGARRAELEQLIDGMTEGARRGDLAVVNELDVRFHEVTVEASGSAQALQLWRSVQPRIRMQFYRLAPRHRQPMEIVEEHTTLLAALLTASEQGVRAALEEHIVGTAWPLVEPGGREDAGG